MNTKKLSLGVVILIFAVGLSACKGNVNDSGIDLSSNAIDEGASVIPTEEIPEPVAYITDPDASKHASEKRVAAGDNFSRGLYERPFTTVDMVYQPDLDIMHATIAEDEEFYYFTLALKGLDKNTQSLTGIYGIEFDRTKTGRGDLLITVQNVKETWTYQGIRIYLDPDTDVGGPNPILADEDFDGNGYEQMLELEDSKLAFASLLPGHPEIIQIALSRSLLKDASEFLWGAWADKGVNEPAAFDYNDNYNAVQAGSPIKEDEHYPLAGLSSVDNTCRQPFGFTPQVNIPGSCLVIPEEVAVTITEKQPSFCCPNIGGCCSFPDSCCPDDDVPPPPPPEKEEEEEEKEQKEPDDSADPNECIPRQSVEVDDCMVEVKTKVECDGTNDIVTLYTSGAGITSFDALTPDFTCSMVDGNIVCTGPKQDHQTPLAFEFCSIVLPNPAPNCRSYPGSFWVENPGICLPLGSSCCRIGNEWLPDEGRCVPIITGDGNAEQGACGDAYEFFDGYCVYKGSLDVCCHTVELPAPCCYSSCVTGYVLNPETLCCDVAPATQSCTWQCTNGAPTKERCSASGGKWVCK